MVEISRDRIQAFIDGCRRVAAADLVRYSSGNMSWRVGGGLMLVTAKGAWLGELTPDDVAVCRIEDRASLNGKTPSVESGFHAGVFLARPDVDVVLHCQSPCATAIACGEPRDYDFWILPEIPFYVGEPAFVDYMTPGSPELATAVIEALKDHDLVVLRNHGQVTVGWDFRDVVQKAGFFEMACDMLLHGHDVRPIPSVFLEPIMKRKDAERGAGSRSV